MTKAKELLESLKSLPAEMLPQPKEVEGKNKDGAEAEKDSNGKTPDDEQGK